MRLFPHKQLTNERRRIYFPHAMLWLVYTTSSDARPYSFTCDAHMEERIFLLSNITGGGGCWEICFRFFLLVLSSDHRGLDRCSI